MKNLCKKNLSNMDRTIRILLGTFLITEGIIGYCVGYDLFDFSTSHCKR